MVVCCACQSAAFETRAGMDIPALNAQLMPLTLPYALGQW